MPSTNETLARRYLDDLWSQGRLEAVPELAAPRCTVRDPLVGDYDGLDKLTAHVRLMRGAFPDLAWTIDEVLADAGPQLALAWSAHGTHGGPLAGMSATGQTFRVSGLLLLRFEDGKLVAITARWEPQLLFWQLATKESELDAQWVL